MVTVTEWLTLSAGELREQLSHLADKTPVTISINPVLCKQMLQDHDPQHHYGHDALDPSGLFTALEVEILAERAVISAGLYLPKGVR